MTTGPAMPEMPPGFPPSPLQPTAEERNWALGAHIGSLVGAWIAMAFLAPLAVLLVKGKESPFVRSHAVESLNFQLTMLLYLVVGVLLVLLTLGIAALVVVPVGIGLGIFWLVVVVIATIRASNGESYRYPLSIRFVK